MVRPNSASSRRDGKDGYGFPKKKKKKKNTKKKEEENQRPEGLGRYQVWETRGMQSLKAQSKPDGAGRPSRDPRRLPLHPHHPRGRANRVTWEGRAGGGEAVPEESSAQDAPRERPEILSHL